MCFLFVKPHLLLLLISAMKLFFLATLINGLLLLSLVDGSSGRQIEKDVANRKNNRNSKVHQPPTTPPTKSTTTPLIPISTPAPVQAVVTLAFKEKGKASGSNFLKVPPKGEEFILFIL
jgi:hypothetical protein